MAGKKIVKVACGVLQTRVFLGQTHFDALENLVHGERAALLPKMLCSLLSQREGGLTPKLSEQGLILGRQRSR
jgi:hypothetical protein